MAAAIAKLFYQLFHGDRPREMPKRRFNACFKTLPVVQLNVDDRVLDQIVQAIGCASCHRQRGRILQTLKREIRQRNIAVHERFGDTERNTVGSGCRIVGPTAHVERLAPWTQLAVSEDLHLSYFRHIKSTAAYFAGRFYERVKMVTGRPRLERDVLQKETGAQPVGQNIRVTVTAVNHRIKSGRLTDKIAIRPKPFFAQESRENSGLVGKGAIDCLCWGITGEHDLARASHLHQCQTKGAAHLSRIELENAPRSCSSAEIV